SAFLKYTPLGRATRASAADHETAQLLGISPVRVGGYAMCIAAAVGALGGLLITPIQFTSASGATSLALYGFVAAVLGGFGRLSGGVIGGLIIVLLLRPQGLLGAPNYGRARRARGGPVNVPSPEAPSSDAAGASGA